MPLSASWPPCVSPAPLYVTRTLYLHCPRPRSLPHVSYLAFSAHFPLRMLFASPPRTELRADAGPQKFVARKACKYAQQGGRLALPALEFVYFFLGIQQAPRGVITGRMLPLVDAQLAALGAAEAAPARYAGGADAFWDDRALALFLRGICLRYVAHPDPDAVIAPAEEAAVREGRAEAERGAREAFEAVFRDGPRVVYDHYLVYYARESGLVRCCVGRHGVGRAADGRRVRQTTSTRGCWRARATRPARGRTWSCYCLVSGPRAVLGRLWLTRTCARRR